MNRTTEKILAALRGVDGDVSGEVLCRSLSISRAAVWKHIQTLRGLGYRIDSATQRGYRLVTPPNTPYPWEIRPYLKTSGIGREIVYQDVVESTNALAVEAARSQNAGEGYCVVADTQQRGRGRLQRSWFSPPGRNLYLSLVLRPSVAPAAVPQLSLVAAMALARAVREFVSDARLQVKWPNDVFIEGRKVAGILCESASEPDRVQYAVVGIGVNVNLAQHDFPSAIADTAGSLRMFCKHDIERPLLAAATLNIFESVYEEWTGSGLEGLLEELEAVSFLRGRQVVVETPRGQRLGRVRGMTEMGALRLEVADGEREEIVYCGDVRVRPTSDT